MSSRPSDWADRDALVSEADFQAAVVALARLNHWKVYGVIDRRDYARRYDKGFPDLTLVRGPVLYWVEVKSEKGKLSPDQEEWMAALKRVAKTSDYIKAEVWRPSDWPMIEAVLTHNPELDW